MRRIHASPKHLAQVEDGLVLLDRLKRKYGPTLDAVIEFERTCREIVEVETETKFCVGCEVNWRSGWGISASARTLSKKRADAARRLENWWRRRSTIWR